MLALLRPGQAALAVALGTLTVLSGAALLAASGALISGAALRPESLLVLMPLITSVRLFGVSRATLRYAERVVSHDLTLRLVGRLRAELLARLVPLAPAALTGARGGDLLARIRVDVDELQGLFVRLVAPAAVAVLASTAAVVLTAFVSPTLALVFAALLLVLGAAVPLWARAAGRVPAREAALADAAFGTDTLDLIRGLADHASGDGGATALRTLDTHLARLDEAERAEARLVGATTFLREGVPALGVVAALWLVGWDVAFGATNPVLLAATALGVLGSFEAVGGLGAAWAASSAFGTRRTGCRPSARRSRPWSSRPTPAPPVGHDAALRGRRADLSRATQPALTGFDLCIGEGEGRADRPERRRQEQRPRPRPALARPRRRARHARRHGPSRAHARRRPRPLRMGAADPADPRGHACRQPAHRPRRRVGRRAPGRAARRRPGRLPIGSTTGSGRPASACRRANVPAWGSPVPS